MSTAAIFIDLENFYRPAKKNIGHEFALRLVAEIGKWTTALRRYDKTGRGSRQQERNFVFQKCYSGAKIWTEISDDAMKFEEFRGINFEELFEYSNYEIFYCPELTGEGKNAADIKLAIDCLRFVESHRHIDEIFIFSGDADYFPLIQEIRRLGPNVFFLNFPS